MNLLRIVNAFYAALFLVLALVSLAFLSASLHEHAPGPADVWVSLGWVALFVLYAILAFLNMRGGGADGPGIRLIALNGAAAAPMLAGALAAELAARFLCGVAAFPFALTGAMMLTKRGRAMKQGIGQEKTR